MSYKTLWQPNPEKAAMSQMQEFLSLIEKKYGFNRTTPKTFVADFFKSMLLMFILGGAIFSLVL